MKKLTVAILCLIAGNTLASDDAKAFFKNYEKLGAEFDVKIGDLYARTAKIHAYRLYPHGLEKQGEMTGAQWRGLVKLAMPVAKAKNDKSTFSNIVITPADSGYKIKADRYSVAKCYKDTGYYMVLGKGDEGQLQIVEEYMETQSANNC